MDRGSTTLNSQSNREVLISMYPDLQNDPNFIILSPTTEVYNCIAWAMQFDDRWVEPTDEDIEGVWWPKEAEVSYRPEALIQAFQAVGFVECDDTTVEDDYDKVILYKKTIQIQRIGKKEPMDFEVWAHASRLVADSVELCKFGKSFDGEHSHNVLENVSAGYEEKSYGCAYAYMKRKKDYDMSHIKDARGSIDVDMAALQQYLHP